MVRTYFTLLTIYCCWFLHMIRITNHIERQVCTDVWSSIKVAISSEKWRTAALKHKYTVSKFKPPKLCHVHWGYIFFVDLGAKF